MSHFVVQLAMRSSPSILVLLPALVLGAPACGGEAMEPAVGGPGAGGGGQAGRAGSEEPFACEPPGFAGAAEPQILETLQGRVEDLDGNGIPFLSSQACGVNLCIFNDSLEDGSVLIDKTSNPAELVKPAFKYGLGREYAKFAFPLPREPNIDLGTHVTVRLPEASASVPLEPGRQVSSGIVTLVLPEEMNDIRPDPFDFDSEALSGFRAAVVPLEQAPAAVDPTLGLELIVAMTPVGTELCPAPELSIENSPGWEPGTAVEVFLHGVEVSEEWAPYGGWAKISDGSVSADGSVIETADDGGLPIISVIGVRRAL